jgi:nucleotide-binding universal stress UspA family protein
MKQKDKILVPLDGSSWAERILPSVEYLAANLNLTIVLIRVAHTIITPGLESDPQEIEKNVIYEAGAYLAQIADQLKSKGFVVESCAQYGDEAEEILNRAEQDDISLIALSTHGRSALKRWLLGNVAEKIIRHTSKPLYLVRFK